MGDKWLYQSEALPVSQSPESPHVDAFEPMHVRPNMPPPRARWLYDPMMGFPDPTSFTLANAPEPLHPENYPPQFVQRAPQPYAQPWNVPLMASTDFTGLLSGESAHPEVTRQIEQPNPRRNWRTQYQPQMELLDPGAPTVSSTPLAILPGMNEPMQRPRQVQPPTIEGRSYVTATPGDQSVYPTSFAMQAMPRAAGRRVLPLPLEQTMIDAFSGQQFPIQPMAVPLRQPHRPRQSPIQQGDTAPQYFEDQQIIGWQTPLALPVRPGKASQPLGQPGELSGETTDLALVEPSDWQPNAPAFALPRPRAKTPHLETIVEDVRSVADVEGWLPNTCRTLPNTYRTQPNDRTLQPVFTEITTANSEFLRSMGGPVRQLPKPLVSPTMAGVETTPQVVAPPYSLTDFAAGMQQPVKQPRRVQQFAMESVSLDTISLAPPAPFRPMDVPTRTLRDPRQSSNLESPYSEAVNAATSSVAFMGMAPLISPKPRPQIVGMHFQAAPAVLQTQFLVEPMTPGVRRLQNPQQASAAIIVDAQYFAGVPLPSQYEANWIVPKLQPRRQPVPIERASTTSFLVGGNPATFVGSGAFVVVAGAVYSLAPVAGKVTRGSKGI